MNLGGIANLFRLSQLFDGGHPRDPAVARMFGTGMRTASGERVSEEGSLGIAGVWSAVRLICECMGSLPVAVFREMSNGFKEKATSHPAYSVLHDSPNADMTPMVYRETSQLHLILYGKMASEILFDQGGNVRGLEPLEPWRVQPERDQGGTLFFRVDGKRRVEQEDMLYIPSLSFNGVLAKSVIHYARESLGHTMAADRFGATFYGNGARFSGVLEHPGKLSDAAYKRLQEQNISESGAANAHKIKILEEGMKFSAQGVNPDEAQFLETRQFQTVEVARWLNVPPHMLKDLTRATFSNIEHQSAEFVIYCLRPWLIRWEQEINRKLLGRGFFCKFNVEGLLRGDSKSRAEFYQVMLQNGIYCVNDVLEREDMNPIGPDGDKRLVQANMTTLDRIGEESAQPAPSPAPRPDDGDDDPSGEPSPSENAPAASEGMRDALRLGCLDMLSAAVGRMLRREAKAAEHAAKSPGEFLTWLDTFYDAHEGVVLGEVKPTFRAWSRIHGGDYCAMAGSFAKRHVAASRQSLLSASECPPAKLTETVSAASERWMTDRLESLETELCPS